MNCKYDGRTIDKKWISFTEVEVIEYGDRAESEMTATGVFCSNNCLVAYISKEKK